MRIKQYVHTKDFNKFDAGIGIYLEPIRYGVRYNYRLTKVGKERSFSGINYTFPNAKKVY